MLILLLAACSERPGYDMAIENVHIVDVESGEIAENRFIYIRDGEIALITDRAADAHIERTIDGSDQ